jgi:hypothetical protein
VLKSNENFIDLCRLLVQEMEQYSSDELPDHKKDVLDALMANQLKQGIVYDKALTEKIFDQLIDEPSTKSDLNLNLLHSKIKSAGYLTETILETISEKMLIALGKQG